jgi:hypothetical protein
MKNILAENMLRFGAKNLTESSKQKLEQLAEQVPGKVTNIPDVTAKPKSIGASGYENGEIAFSGAYLAYGTNTATLYNKSDRKKRVVFGPTNITVDGQVWNSPITTEDTFNILAYMARTLYGKCLADEARSIFFAVKNLSYDKSAPAEVKALAKQLVAIQVDVLKFPMDDFRRFVYEKFPNSRKIDVSSSNPGTGWKASAGEAQLLYQVMNTGPKKPSALDYDKQPGQRLNPNKPTSDREVADQPTPDTRVPPGRQ